MGTRGFISFVVDGQEKTAYNHWDSYPDGLGLAVLRWLRECTLFGGEGHDWDSADNTRPTMPAVRERAKALRVVPPNSKPTADDIERLSKWANTDVSTGKLEDWYVLLRDTQGKPGAILRAGVIEDAGKFPLDSLFAEWGYVIDLDGDGLFEAYRGFVTAPHDKGRFAKRTEYLDEQRANPRTSGDLYYPVALAARFPLANLPSDKEFLAVLQPQEEMAEG